ncbi:hypothetical protein K7711_23645 [Nocardia sp. CA2R105]|uniref:hypothetical protein n=1 Tax=Nocardia coffeae TaxID=2873381 RepID=UPI001CA69C7D|nr:hypothetical protein [Nocardia coffeae]MBY8859482.1 hypothetical protein [Nocardia coffeae]
MPSFSPVTVDALVEVVLDRALALPGYAVVAVDGADPADPLSFAEIVADRIRTRGRACATVSLHDYVRPASLRLEFGRDEMSYRTAWFDYAGLNREVLQALRERGRWLPALWDESTDRSARATTISANPETILLVAGPMLLDRGLSFDLTVELRLSEGALRRAEAEPFIVAALLRHRRDAHEEPDILVAWDHRDRPALQVRDQNSR